MSTPADQSFAPDRAPEPVVAPAPATPVPLEKSPTPVPARTGGVFRALDLWGFARSEKLQYLALLITGSFVFLEARYNVDLLDTLTDPTATREVIQALSDRGKLLAAIGISWACGRFLLERIRPALLGIVLLGALSTGVYHGLDHLYFTVIRDLPAAVKLKGFSLFSYRQDLLTGRLSDPDIPLPADDPVEGRLIMGAFPIVLIDERFMLPARDIIERKADDKIRFVLRDAEASWPEYAKQMGELERGYRDFNVNSKKAVEYGRAGVDEFVKKSGGLAPDPSLSREQFVDMLKGSDHPQGKKLREAEAREIARRPDGRPVLAGEIPRFMNHATYLDWFESQAKDARDQAIPTIDTVERMEGIQEMNSAVFLPPMAMIASLTSALTNGLTFVILLAGMVARRVGPPAVRKAGVMMGRFSAPLMLASFAALLMFSPTYVFRPGPLQDLEQKMHQTVGIAGHVWSRLSNVQTLLLHGKQADSAVHPTLPIDSPRTPS